MTMAHQAIAQVRIRSKLPKNSFLLLSPFPFDGKSRHNVNVDPVITRHSGAKTKSGVFYPTGLGYVSSVLKNHGFSCHLIDPVPQQLTQHDVERLADKASFIIMPVSSTRYDETVTFLKNYPNKVRIAISNFASIYAEKLIRNDICDIVVHGEVESTCLEIAKAYQNTRSPLLSEIAGISFKNKNTGEAIKTTTRPLTKDLDSIPFPDRDSIHNNAYTDIAFFGAPTAYILTARGCPFRCTFCSTHLMYNYRVYFRSPENVVDEIEEVVNRYGITNFFFIDDTFTMVPRRVRHICDLIIKRRLNIKWVCHGRLDIINEPMLIIMKRAGCIEIRSGVESGNNQILKDIKKQLTTEQVETGVSLIEKHGIRNTLFFMIGNPGETKKTIKETIHFAKKLNATFVSFNIATPLPGSDLFEKYRESFQFQDIKTFDTLSSKFSMCGIPPRTLRRFLVFAYSTYYLRLGFFVKLLWEFKRQPREALNSLRFLLLQAKAIVF